MFINNPFIGAFGMDIGDSSIKLVRLEKKWRPKKGYYFELADLRQIDLPPGCIIKGEIEQPDTVKEKIYQLLGKIKGLSAIRTPWVVIDLPVSKTFLKLIQVYVPESQINEETVRLEAIKHLPLELKDTDIDWQIMQGDNPKQTFTNVLIGAAQKKIVDSYVNLIKSAGLIPLAVEIEDISISRAMITAEKSYQNEARAILDLGGSRSSIIIYDQGTIQFSALLNFSGDQLDSALAQNLKIDSTAANKLIKKNGLNFVSTHPLYLKCATETAEILAESIRNVFSFYRDHFPSPNNITHITMSGGMSAMKNLDKFLTDKLSTEASAGNAWKNLHGGAEQDKESGLAMASAIGLALRAAEWPIGKQI